MFLFFSSQTFAFEIKMSDAISPFFSEDKGIKHYSGIPFYQFDKNTLDLVDKNQLEESKIRFQEYVKLLYDNGYNSISLDDLNHLVTFEKSGFYKNSILEKRNKFYIDYYKDLINIAKDNSLGVYIITDMQFYTDLLEKKVGDIETENKKLRRVNKEAIEELFINFPDISGIIMRIGEGGKAYNNGTYKSEIIYTSPKQVNSLLKSLEDIFIKYNKKLIFRTWTIGIGEVGDLITNKKTYDDTFFGLNKDYLIVSVKSTPGDFFWFENLNPIVGYGDFKQIVELEVRREYEGGGDFPNYIGDYYNQIYEQIKTKKNVVGVWNWNQTGGWGWGKNILFNFGFNFWNEINFYAVGYILNERKVDLDEILSKYAFLDGEKKVLKDILLNSREIIKKGWYIDDFRKKDLIVKGIYIPSLSRIWWDKITSSPVILSLIFNSLDKKYDTIEDSSYALGLQKKEIKSWEETMIQNDLNEKILNSLIDRYKIFEINHIFKKAFISYFQTGEKPDKDLIYQKINEYNNFKSDKEYINFDFYEIYKFYKNDNFKKLYFYINIISFFIFIIFLFFYNKILSFHKKSNKHKVFVLSFLILDILVLTLSPFFFISSYNFYWLLIKINYVFMFFILIYFFVLNKTLSFLYKINIKLKASIGKLIYSLTPIIITLESIIIVSYIFGEQFFWKFLTLGLLESNVKILGILLLLLYILLFIYYGFIFSNIYNFFHNIKYKKITYLLSFAFLALYFIILFSIDYSSLVVNDIIKNFIPSYFNSAGSDVKQFF